MDRLDFDAPRLNEAIDTLTPAELDALPYGVIGLDAQDSIRVYNKTEANSSGYGNRPALGKSFFLDVAPCMNSSYFKGRIEKARASGTLDIRFSFVGDFSDSARELTVRVQAARDGGAWIFNRRAGA